MFQSLTNELLMERFGKLVRTERKITHLIIECIAEIELRKIYLEKAYPSVFEYLTQEFGYSEASASPEDCRCSPVAASSRTFA